MATQVSHSLRTGACPRAFAAAARRRVACAGKSSSSSSCAAQQPGGGGSGGRRRGVLQLLAGGAAAMLGSRSVAAAAAVDQAAQVRQIAPRGGLFSPAWAMGAHDLSEAPHPLPCRPPPLQVLEDPQWPEQFPFKPEFFQRWVVLLGP